MSWIIFQCKHVLAVYIAQGLSNVNERKVSDEDFAEILTCTKDCWNLFKSSEIKVCNMH